MKLFSSQFQLSIARRMLNGQLPNDDDKVVETDKRHAFKVLKKSETFSGLRRGLSGFAGKVPLTNNNNGKTSEIKVFEVFSFYNEVNVRNQCLNM